MKGSEIQLLNFMEGADKRFIIPVYQRKYDWRQVQCQQLYSDLVHVVTEKRSNHFFGSIVSSISGDGSLIYRHIIDGQQRLTTITLLLLAMANLLTAGKIQSEDASLAEQIMERFVIAKWAKPGDKIKLRLIEKDQDALEKLIAGDETEYDKASNLTINYNFFCSQLQKSLIPVSELFGAIGKLQVIGITLEHGDDAQLIFESLNSTGLALTEGDKIRNYVLMGLEPKLQEKFYGSYWKKIERNASNNVSAFVRDYLSIKTQKIPVISDVYRSFKQYVEVKTISTETLLKDLLDYSSFYHVLISGHCDFIAHKTLQDCLYRLNRLEVAVTEPFFMTVLKLAKEGTIPSDDVDTIFSIVESYLFRRNICDVPTNALGKVFLNLNREIYRYEQSYSNYVEKLKYALLIKKESSRFPDNQEFTDSLTHKQIYLMRGKYKDYLFERFENFGTVETKDVYQLLDNNTYTIEHIMPQTLTLDWKSELGADAEHVQETWLHRLGNLTLTGYNPHLSNASFAQKRDGKNGYAQSGLRMNQRLAKFAKWGPEEMEQRSIKMAEQAVNAIWPYPSSSFVPSVKEYESCSLDDDSLDLTGKELVKYSFKETESVVASWVDMFLQVIRSLYTMDRSIILSIIFSTEDTTGLGLYFSNDAGKFSYAAEIDQDVFVNKNLSTRSKIFILRRLFELYTMDPLDLVFYFKDGSKKIDTDSTGRKETLIKYWTVALPVLNEHNQDNRMFNGLEPISYNSINGYIGLNGFVICCAFLQGKAFVELYLGNTEREINKKVFDYLIQHKPDIESSMGTDLEWERNDAFKNSKIVISLNGVDFRNESDWSNVIEFQAKWSHKFWEVFYPYLQKVMSGQD